MYMKFDNMMNFNLKKEPLHCPHALGQLNLKSDRFTNCFKCPRGTTFTSENIIKPQEMVNTPELKQLRKSLMAGEWPKDYNCESCRSSEEIGYESTRKKELKFYQESNNINMDWYLNNVDEDGKIEAINYLEFRFRNSCNLACRHCSPDYSTQWNKVVDGSNYLTSLRDMQGNQDNGPVYESKPHRISPSQAIPNKEWVKFIIENIDKIEKNVKLGNDWFQKNSKPLFYTNMPRTDSKLNMFIIETSGGEPFFQLEFYDLLQELDKYPEYKKKISFGITTNGIIATKFKNYDVKKLLSGFGTLKLTLSLDASESFYEYFRARGTWKQATSGVIPMVKDIIEENHVQLSFSVTPTVFQCFKIEDMHKDFTKLINRPLLRRDIIISHLTYPKYLQMRWIPQGLKDKFLKQFDELMTRYSNYSGVARLIEQPYKEMSYKKIDQKEQQEQWKIFCKVTKELDKAHNTNVFDYFPELKEYWVE